MGVFRSVLIVSLLAVVPAGGADAGPDDDGPVLWAVRETGEDAGDWMGIIEARPRIFGRVGLEASFGRAGGEVSRRMRVGGRRGEAHPVVRLPEGLPRDWAWTRLGTAEWLPLGAYRSVGRQPSYFRIYLPSAVAGRLRVRAQGATLALLDADPSRPVATGEHEMVIDLPAGSQGWRTLRVDGPGACVDASLTETVEADRRPWDFWYYPYCDRPQGEPLWAADGPLAKYDRVHGTQAREIEARIHSGARPGLAWTGHCHGGTLAAILYPEPRAVTVTAPDGSEVRFEPSDLKALLTEVMTDLGVQQKAYFDRCPGGPPGKHAREPVDAYAGRWHEALQDGIARHRVALMVNLRPSSGRGEGQVWNHAVFAYTSRYRQAAMGDPRVVEVETTTRANRDVTPDRQGLGDRADRYRYVVGFDENGRINRDDSRQNWLEASGFAPEYAWRVLGVYGDNQNTEVRRDLVERLLAAGAEERGEP